MKHYRRNRVDDNVEDQEQQGMKRKNLGNNQIKLLNMTNHLGDISIKEFNIETMCYSFEHQETR